jgi:hypothetical protein
VTYIIKLGNGVVQVIKLTAKLDEQGLNFSKALSQVFKTFGDVIEAANNLSTLSWSHWASGWEDRRMSGNFNLQNIRMCHGRQRSDYTYVSFCWGWVSNAIFQDRFVVTGRALRVVSMCFGRDRWSETYTRVFNS